MPISPFGVPLLRFTGSPSRIPGVAGVARSSQRHNMHVNAGYLAREVRIHLHVCLKPAQCLHGTVCSLSCLVSLSLLCRPARGGLVSSFSNHTLLPTSFLAVHHLVHPSPHHGFPRSLSVPCYNPSIPPQDRPGDPPLHPPARSHTGRRPQRHCDGLFTRHRQSHCPPSGQ